MFIFIDIRAKRLFLETRTKLRIGYDYCIERFSRPPRNSLGFFFGGEVGVENRGKTVKTCREPRFTRFRRRGGGSCSRRKRLR